MTLLTLTDRIESAGDGVSTAFPFPYYFLADSDIVVIARSSTGVETLRLLGPDYTMSGATHPEGGTVNMLIAPAIGVTLVRYRDPTATQEVDYVEGDKFPAETHERALDKLTMLLQRILSRLSRTLALRITDPTTGGSYDASTNYIINVKDPVNNQDAVTFNFLKTYVAGVITGVITVVLTTDYGTLLSGTQVKYRRGTTADHSTFTGASGEITVDTSKNTLVVHDGATVGGLAVLATQGQNGTTMKGRFGLMAGAAVASEAVPQLGLDGNIWHITGGNTITGFGAPQGCGPYFLIFDGTLTLLHNATSFDLPGGANITTAAGDVAQFVQNGNQSGNWKCVMYTRAAGAAAGATIPTGTRMLFNQTSAPIGWTKETGAGFANRALRLTTGTTGSGGSTVFTSVFGASKNTSSHTLTISEMPPHTHSVAIASTGSGTTPEATGTGAGSVTTTSSGGGSGHTHPLSLDLAYVDIIIAQAP